MQLEHILQNLSRPKVLLTAASFGLNVYSREKDLKQLLGVQKQPNPQKAVADLLARETELEKDRKSGNAAYDMKLHVHIMTALLQELHLIPKFDVKY